jgi:hypothetical protein
MAKNWKSLLAAHGTAWGLPPKAETDLDKVLGPAETALETAQNEGTRTPVATAHCRTAFEALTAVMRDLKRRYFFSPPLEDSDFIALGLKPRDTAPTPAGTPEAQAAVETYLIGRHELGVKIQYLTGSPQDPANKGYRIWYTLLSAGEDPPANPEALGHYFFTKRKKDVIPFAFEDSGKTCWMAVQIENESRKGPWGPLVSALIP